MISMIFSYILLGISLSAPVGPINVAQINKGIKMVFECMVSRSWSNVSRCCNDVFNLLWYFDLFNNSSCPALHLDFGFVTMIYLGYESMKEATKQVQYISSGEKEHPLKSFLSGFAIAISNPLNIIFWIGIYGSVLTSAMNTIGKEQALWYSAAILLGLCFGIYLWLHLFILVEDLLIIQ